MLLRCPELRRQLRQHRQSELLEEYRWHFHQLQVVTSLQPRLVLAALSERRSEQLRAHLQHVFQQPLLEPNLPVQG